MACDYVVFFIFATIIAFNLGEISGFNVDTENIIRHRGAAGSMFGFSVAEHRDRGYSWVLVGAPEAQTRQPEVIKGGAVFRCDVSRDDACQEVPFDVSGNFVNSEGRTLDNKTEQWFGATVQSSGEDGVVVACAPRYMWYSQNLSRRDPVGTCYVARNSFSEYSEYSPCRTRSWGHHRQGSCQAGLGASISKDGERLYVGAVGSWYWQGQIYSIDSRVKLPYTPPGYRYPFGTGQLFSQSLSNRPAVIFTHESSPVDDDSYLGYSVAVGDFGDVGGAGAAVGMPRGDGLYGKILFYSWNLTNNLNLTGEQLGAYFGYSLCVSDMDGDGRDDLIVGAPLFTHLSNKDDKYETGRIYVFYQKKDYDNRFAWVHRRDGKNSKSRFGLSLTSLGDINMDKYGDIAVGAPYDGINGRGAVYIYHGSDNGVMEKPSQIILAEDVLPTLSTFGFSISGGIDLDENQYPDLVVGAYEADTAVFLRARPVVNLTARVIFLEELKQLSLEEKTCTLKDGKTKVTCTKLSACLEYNGIGVDQKLDFEVQFVLDAKKPKNPRMYFLSDAGRNIMNYTLRLDKGDSFCKNYFVYVKDEIRDKLTPLEVEMRYSLRQQTGRRRVTRSLFPVLDQSKHIVRRDSINIQKNCGSDNICIPDLNIRVTPSVERYLLGSESRLELDVLVENSGEDSFETVYIMTVPEGINYVRIDQAQKDVLCSAPSRSNNNTLKCDLGNPLPQKKLVQFKVLLKPTLVEVSRNHYEFKMSVNSTNPEDEGTTKDNSLRLIIPIWIDAELELSGHSDPPDLHYNMSVYTSTAPISETEVGPQLLHTYKIYNKGPSEIKEAEAYFVWPSFTEDDENILYLVEMRKSEIGVPVTCEFLEGKKANALGLKVDWKKKSSTETSSSTSVKGSGSEQSSSSSSTTFTSTSSGTSRSFNGTVHVHKEQQQGGHSHWWSSLTEEERRRIEEERRLEEEEEEAKRSGVTRVSSGGSYQETHYESSSNSQVGGAAHKQAGQGSRVSQSGDSSYNETHYESSSGGHIGGEAHGQGAFENRGQSGGGDSYHETHYESSSSGHVGGETHGQGVSVSRGGQSGGGGGGGSYRETHYEFSSGGHVGGETHGQGVSVSRGGQSGGGSYHETHYESSSGGHVEGEAHGQGAFENRGGQSGGGGAYRETHYKSSSDSQTGGEAHRQGVVDSRGRGGQEGISSSGGSTGIYRETHHESSSGSHLGGEAHRPGASNREMHGGRSTGGRGSSSYNYIYSNWTTEGDDGSNVGIAAYGRGSQEITSRGESHRHTSSNSAESGLTSGSVHGSQGGGSTTYVDSSGGSIRHYGTNWSSGDAYGSNYDRRTQGGLYGGSKEFHVSEETSDIQDNIGASYQGSHHSTGSGRTSSRGSEHGQSSSNQFSSDLEEAAQGSGGLRHFVWTPEISGGSSSSGVGAGRESSSQDSSKNRVGIGIETDEERRHSAGGIGYERAGGRQHSGSSSGSQASWSVEYGPTGDNVNYNTGHESNYNRQYSSSQSGYGDRQFGREHGGGAQYSSSHYESSSGLSSRDGTYTENKLDTGNADDQTSGGLKLYRKYRHNGSNENGGVLHRRQRRQTDNSEIERMTHCNASKCSVMKCVIGRMEKEQEIIFELRYRIWVQTFKTFGYSKPVNVSTLLATRLTRLPYIGAPQEESLRSMEVVTEVVATDAPLKPEIVPLWIVVLSACAGTLILLLLIFLLWKCGFFKRNRPSNNAPEKVPLNRNGHYEPGDEAL